MAVQCCEQCRSSTRGTAASKCMMSPPLPALAAGQAALVPGGAALRGLRKGRGGRIHRRHSGAGAGQLAGKHGVPWVPPRRSHHLPSHCPNQHFRHVPVAPSPALDQRNASDLTGVAGLGDQGLVSASSFRANYVVLSRQSDFIQALEVKPLGCGGMEFNGMRAAPGRRQARVCRTPDPVPLRATSPPRRRAALRRRPPPSWACASSPTPSSTSFSSST